LPGVTLVATHRYGLENGLLDIGVFDAAGTTGDGNLVRSLPDYKANVTLNWSRGRHSVTAINRFVGFDTDLTARLRYPDCNHYVRELLQETISSHVTLDLQYRYTHDWRREALGTTVFTVGLLDALEQRVPYGETGCLNCDATVFDGGGRRACMRALWQF
jgi:iron complex outermembrane receptor protein